MFGGLGNAITIWGAQAPGSGDAANYFNDGYRFGVASSAAYDWDGWENDASLHPNQTDGPSFTVAFEFRITSAADTMWIFSTGNSNGGSSDRCRLQFHASGSVAFKAREFSTGTTLVERRWNDVTSWKEDGDWHLVVISFDSVATDCSMYYSDGGTFQTETFTDTTAPNVGTGTGNIDFRSYAHFGMDGNDALDENPLDEVEIRGFYAWDTYVDLSDSDIRDKFWKNGERVTYGDGSLPTGSLPVFTANASPTELNFGSGFGGSWLDGINMVQRGRRGVDYPTDINKVAFFPHTQIFDGSGLGSTWTVNDGFGDPGTQEQHLDTTWPADGAFPDVFGGGCITLSNSVGSITQGIFASAATLYDPLRPDTPLNFLFWSNNVGVSDEKVIRIRLIHDQVLESGNRSNFFFVMEDVGNGFFSCTVSPKLLDHKAEFIDGAAGAGYYPTSVFDGLATEAINEQGSGWDRTHVDISDSRVSIDVQGFNTWYGDPNSGPSFTQALCFLGVTRGYNHTPAVFITIDDGNDSLVDQHIDDDLLASTLPYNVAIIPQLTEPFGGNNLSVDNYNSDMVGDFTIILHEIGSWTKNHQTLEVSSLTGEDWNHGDSATTPLETGAEVVAFINDGAGTGRVIMNHSQLLTFAVDETLLNAVSGDEGNIDVIRDCTEAEYDVYFTTLLAYANALEDLIPDPLNPAILHLKHAVYPQGGYKDVNTTLAQAIRAALLTANIKLIRGGDKSWQAAGLTPHVSDTIGSVQGNWGLTGTNVGGIALENTIQLTDSTDYVTNNLRRTHRYTGGLAWLFAHIFSTNPRDHTVVNMNIAEAQVIWLALAADRDAGLVKVLHPQDLYSQYAMSGLMTLDTETSFLWDPTP